MDKVYIVSSGFYHDHSSIDKVFSKKEDAYRFAKNLAKEENIESSKPYQYLALWTDSLQFIKVEEFTIE